MKSVLLCCSTLSMLTLSSASANDQDDSSETRPVMVASFSGYAKLNQNLEYVGSLIGNPGLAVSVKQLVLPSTQGEALAGLDETRPWGAWLSITDDGLRFPFRIFLPINDFGKLLGALASNDETNEVDDGIYAIDREKTTFFITQRGEWGYISRQKSALSHLPDDPLKELRGLDSQYDLALSIDLQNIPAVLRTTVASVVKRGLQAGSGGGHSDDDEQSDASPQVARGAAQAWIKGLATVDRVTAGLNIDRSTNRTSLDVELTTLGSGEPIKQRTARVREPSTTRLLGDLSPNAIFSILVDQTLTNESKQSLKTWLIRFREELPTVFDRAAYLDEKHKTQGKKLAERLLDVFEKTIEQGRVDIGLAVAGAKSADTFGDIVDQAVRETFPNHVQETIIGAGHLNLVVCGLTAEGATFEEVVMQAISMIAEAAEEDPPKLNIDQYKGRRFHTFSITVPQTLRADWPLRTLRNLLGNPLKLVVAFGGDTFFAAVGENGEAAIKQVIDQLFESPEIKRPSLNASLSLSKVWNFLVPGNRDPLAARISEILSQSGTHNVTFTVDPVAGGLRCRAEGDAGVTRLLAFGLAMATGVGINFEAMNVNRPRDDGVTTTTTANDDGSIVTTTRTETADGRRSSSVTTTRRSDSGNQPLRPKEAPVDDREQQDSGRDTALRIWSSKGGKYEVMARFVELIGTLVRLEKEDGERVTIAIDKLSETDQKLARELAELADEENPFIVKSHKD